MLAAMTVTPYEFSRSFVADRDPSGTELRRAMLLPPASTAPARKTRSVLAAGSVAVTAVLTLSAGVVRVLSG